MTKHDRREQMLDNIKTHGENLLAVFPNAKERNPDKLARRVRRWEVKAHKLATDYCNGVNGVDTDSWGVLSDAILSKVNELLGNTAGGPVPVFVNGDARGYALKIQDEWVRANGVRLHTDWGGYGIIAPDLSPCDN